MAETKYDNAIKLQKILLSNYLKKGMKAADMTMGNGEDTVFLLDCVGPEGKVFALDIQEEALMNTRRRLGAPLPQNCTLILDSHENCDKYIAGDELDLALFNLGYLPGGDKKITTEAKALITAVEKILRIIKHKGLVSIVVYKTHDNAKEHAALCEYIRKLDQRYFNVLISSFVNQKNEPPEHMIIEKR